MGNKISVVRGVKSDHFYDQGNAINEIWVGDVEVVSRLPFGDSDQEQAGWPPGGVPKIPWHQFIIPLHKREEVGNMSVADKSFITSCHRCTCDGWLPRNGYLGMYTGIDPLAADFTAMLLFFLAGVLIVNYLFMLGRAYYRWEIALLVSKQLSDRGENGTEIKHQSWYRFRISLVLPGISLALSTLLVILALPALAAATQDQNAASFVLLRGSITSVGLFLGITLAPIYLIMKSKPQPEDRSTELELQGSASRCNSVGVEAGHRENETKGFS